MTAVSALDAYRILADGYDNAPNPLLSLNRRTLPTLLPTLDGQVVIDVAAGTGYWANWCVDKGARAIAVDFCREMLQQSQAPAVLADALSLPFAAEYADIVICSFGLGYAAGCFAELARITRCGGVVIVSDMHPDAIDRGWSRSFRGPNGVVEVEHARYRISDLAAPRLEREMLLEPHFGDAERAIFGRAGKFAQFETAARYPAIFAARWRRV